MSSTNRGVFLYCDGGCRGNPGPGAIGVLITDGEQRELASLASCIGRTTNNRAEYTALIRVLELATKHTRGAVNCSMDSQLVVNQMNGTWRIKDPELRRLHHEAKEREAVFKQVTYGHVRRSHPMIRRVDQALNDVMDAFRSDEGSCKEGRVER